MIGKTDDRIKKLKAENAELKAQVKKLTEELLTETKINANHKLLVDSTVEKMNDAIDKANEAKKGYEIEKENLILMKKEYSQRMEELLEKIR